jgi:hypothetical protein
MENQKFELSSVEVLDQAENLLRAASEEIEIETRLDKSVEVFEAVRAEQELISLIDRVRNTEGQISILTGNKSLPAITGEVRFTSDKYIVITNQQSDFLISLDQILLVNQVAEQAVFRTNHILVETTTMWIKNLIDLETEVNIYLVGGHLVSGKLIRFGHDHLDVQINLQTALIPTSAISIIRSKNEKYQKN